MGGSERLPDSAGLRIPVDMALAFHSDAGVRDGDGIIGTLGIFFTRENKGKFQGGADRYRSRDLTDLVQTQIVEDIRRTCEPAWSRRGMWNRAYYEARVPGVPTMLLELLSHQNFADMRLGHDPRFKFLVSRAVYKGILRYVSSQYDLPYVVQPLPVEAFAAEFAAAGEVALSWSPAMDPLEATAAPTGYVVYTRVDDGGFDNGRYVDKPRLTVRQEPGRMYSYRVTAVNEGGESFPSETLAACRVPDEKGCVLIVNGFDRVSAPQSERNDSLAGFRMDLDGGVADRQDIAFIGAQRVFDLAQARCNVDTAFPALGPGCCWGDRHGSAANTFPDHPPRTAFGRAAGYLLGVVGPGRGAGRGVARSSSGRRPDPGQAAPPRCRGVARRPSSLPRRSCRSSCGVIWPAAEGFWGSAAADLWAEGTLRRGARSPGRCSARLRRGHPSSAGRVRVMTSDASFRAANTASIPSTAATVTSSSRPMR